MLTIQILTLNNEKSLQKTIQSILPLQAKIIVVDRGSTDQTLNVAVNHGAIIQRYSDLACDRAEARNRSLKNINPGMMLWLNPGEAVVRGHNQLKNIHHGSYNINIIQNNIINKELRIWHHNGQTSFKGPYNEYLGLETDVFAPVYLYSEGDDRSIDEKELILKSWKEKKPLDAKPYYYEAFLLLSQCKYTDFLRISEYYMFLKGNDLSLSSTMNRYYYATVQLMHNKKVKPTLQNLNLCLCANPLMAEFWCLIGDTYYHLLNKFDYAKEFYEIGRHVGAYRPAQDIWPMDLTKYEEYPKKMIESCNKLLEAKGTYSF